MYDTAYYDLQVNFIATSFFNKELDKKEQYTFLKESICQGNTFVCNYMFLINFVISHRIKEKYIKNFITVINQNAMYRLGKKSISNPEQLIIYDKDKRYKINVDIVLTLVERLYLINNKVICKMLLIVFMESVNKLILNSNQKDALETIFLKKILDKCKK